MPRENQTQFKSKTTSSNMLSDVRIPPHNLEAEQSVLGSLMLDKDAVIKIADLLKVGDFYKDDHNLIYEVILDLYEHREPIDVLSLSNKLDERKQLEKIGGSTYLANLVGVVPSASHIVHYAKVVQKKALLRRLINAATEILEAGYREGDDIEKILDEAEQKLFGVSQKYIKQDFIPIRSILESAFNRIDELHRDGNKFRGIPTGFPDLDGVLAGLQKSDLVILAARPSIGKTSLALDIARHIAVRENVAVGMFSLEMSADQLVDRMLAAESNVDLWRLRTGRLKSEGDNNDFQRIGEAMGILSEAKLFIDDTASANIMEMRTMARRLQAEHNLGLIIIDYLQLMEGRGGENRVQEISEISRGLKNLARELNIPILALSQLSRAVESRSPQIPKLSDLRESGSIEQDADVVLFLYREDREKPDTPNKGVVKIIIAKHRNGPVGEVSAFFQENSASFKSLEKIHTQN
jgi:replicative DNA helicase